jgi:hypothetical protein
VLNVRVRFELPTAEAKSGSGVSRGQPPSQLTRGLESAKARVGPRATALAASRGPDPGTIARNDGSVIFVGRPCNLVHFVKVPERMGPTRQIASDIRMSKRPPLLLRWRILQTASNPFCIGQLRHRKESHPGNHERIGDQDLWDKKQLLRCPPLHSENKAGVDAVRSSVPFHRNDRKATRLARVTTP